MMATIWRSKWIILITALIAAGLVAFQSLRQEITYQADAVVVVGDLGLGQSTNASLQASDQLASSYSELLQTRDVLQKSIDDAGLNKTPAELRNSIVASTSKDSPFIKMSAFDSTANSAIADVNAAAVGLTAHLRDQQFKIIADGKQNVSDEMTKVENELIAINNSENKDPGRIAALQEQRQSLITEYEGFVTSTNNQMVSVVSLADSASASVPRTLRDSILGLLVGAVAGVGLGFAFDSMKKAINREGIRDT